MPIDPINDFRLRRSKLPLDAFAIAPDKEPDPTDPIDESTWSSITSLPDDVALRTTDFHGAALHQAHEFWGNWVSLVLDLQGLVESPKDDPLCVVSLAMGDELQ